MSAPLRGIFNILATPFDAAQQVDFASLRHLVNFQLALGAHGLTILGVLGEAAKLRLDERRAVMDTVMETVAGRVPVVVGASHADRDARLSLCKAAFSAGAAAVMVAPPKIERPTDDDVIGLYADIGAAVDRPIVVQDFPPVNNVIMSPEMLAVLAEEVPHCRTLKLEDPPLMEKIAAIRARTDKFAIFGGLGGMFLLEELARGAAGTMTGFAFTEVLVAIYDAFSQGRQADAETIFDLYLPLIRYENQPVVNLTIRKEMLFRRGAIACPALRDPFAPIDAGTHDEMTWILRRVGIEDPTRRLSL